MLKIVVMGHGKIPRGFGLAPRKDPFKADLKLISLILKTGGLEPYFINPDTGVKTRLTMENYERMYATYGTEKKSAQVVVIKKNPIVQKEIPLDIVVQNKPAEQPKPAVEEKKEEEKREESMSITPVANPNNNNNGNNNKHNNKH